MRERADRRDAPAGRCGQSIDQLFFVVAIHRDDGSSVLAVLESSDVLRVFDIDVLSRAFFSREAAERDLDLMRRQLGPVRAAALLASGIA